MYILSLMKCKKKVKKKLVNLKKYKTLPDVSRKEDLDIHLKKF